MENLIHYVNLRKDLSFTLRPYNEIDFLVFAELAYIDWNGIVDEEPILLQDACRKYFEERSQQQIDDRFSFSQNIPELARCLQDTLRYEQVRLEHYKEVFDEDQQIQFGVIMVRLSDGSMVISFRGTDGSINGWKENMRMTYQNDLECQRLALDYFQKLMIDIPEKSFLFGFVKKKVYPKVYLTGHSKGGNLAMYAAMKAQKEFQDKISYVYAFDAPGFRPSFYDLTDTQSIMPRIMNYKPQDSLIGVLLEHKEPQQVIEATGTGLLQHDAFSWKVTPDRFLYLDHLSSTSRETLELIEDILLSKTDEEKKEYIDSVFSIIDHLDIQNVSNITDIGMKQIFTGVKELASMTSDERKFIFSLVGILKEQTAAWLKVQKKGN